MRSKLNLSWIFFISFFICWFIPCNLWASVQVDGIYYDLNTSTKTAAVAPNPDYYTGVIDIPSNFVYEGNSYSVTSIGYCAFLDCNELSVVNMPSSVTTIENSAFERSTGLTELVVGSGVTTIKTESFKNCICLTSLTLPKSLKSIGAESFSGCSSLTEIIEERTTPPTINSNTFNGVDKSVCKVYVPEGCRSAYASASYWKTFSNIEERTIVATGSCGDKVTYSIYADLTMVISGTGAIRDYVNTNLHIGANYYQQIKKVVIENGVTSIGQFAFSDCTGLISVRIPNSVTSIGNAAFYGCSNLTSIIIPNSVTTIGNAAFYKCINLPSVNIPNSVNALSYGLFFGCTGLNSITIPNSVTSIGEAAFESCSSLTSVSIPSRVNQIGIGAFTGCSSMTSITVDVSNSFYDSRDDCNAIIETATNTLIAGCVNSVIPSSVLAIGEAAFRSCTGLTSATIPNDVTTIDNYAFYGCTSLASMTLGNGVTAIGMFAFYNCAGLNSMTIPNSVATISDYSFANCSGLASITVENDTPIALGYRAFVNVDKAACTLYVPIGSKSAYESADGWNEFQTIEEYGEEPNTDTDISALDNAIYVERVEGRIGGTMDISVKIKNSYAVRGFQFTFELPEGTTISSWALSTNRLPQGATLNDMISTHKIEGNKISVACSLNYGGQTFTGNDGEIATVNVTFGEDMKVGTYPVYFTACDVTTTGGTDEDLSDIKATLVLEDYVLGDANGDGKVRIGDATTILNYIVGTVLESFNEKAADANGDGKIRIGDATSVLNIIVNQ